MLKNCRIWCEKSKKRLYFLISIGGKNATFIDNEKLYFRNEEKKKR